MSSWEAEVSKLTYMEAGAAMQAGVGLEISLNLNNAHTPKHLRVGLNSAFSEHSALAKLLIAKGLITEDEYIEAVAEGMRREVARYEEVLSKHFGMPVTLGCDESGHGVVSIGIDGAPSPTPD
jgi:hypothetical protein